MEGLEVADADLTVYVHPSKAKKIRDTVLRQLSSILFTYDDKFDGVLLAHEVHYRSRKAMILPGLFPYLEVKLKATLLLFSPKPGMMLEGKVVKLGNDSIHVIVLGFCSAAILSEDIREEFKYMIRDGENAFVSKSHKRHTIMAGSTIQFLVKSLDEEILHITGSLLPPHTGCVRWLAKYGVEDDLQNKRSVKRHREKDIENEEEDQHPGLSRRVDGTSDHRRPHKSRKKSVEK